jgi:hypothetical protein
MQPSFDALEPCPRFSESLQRAANGAEDRRLLGTVRGGNQPELAAWIKYDLRFADGSIGHDPESWAARLDAIEELRCTALDQLIKAAREEVAAMADPGSATNCVVMDTTTLASNLDLLTGPGDTLSAAAIMDLETFIRAYVLYDHVICMPPVQAVDVRLLNEALRERFLLPLAIHDATYSERNRLTPLGAVLYSLFHQSTDWMTQRSPGPLTTEVWQTMLGQWELILGWRPEIVRAAVEFDSGINSDPSIVRWLTNLVYTAREEKVISIFGPGMHTYRLITQSTARCLFHMELARVLGLPYSPNVGRIPSGSPSLPTKEPPPEQQVPSERLPTRQCVSV